LLDRVECWRRQMSSAGNLCIAHRVACCSSVNLHGGPAMIGPHRMFQINLVWFADGQMIHLFGDF
jgi:hypothetical protein